MLKKIVISLIILTAVSTLILPNIHSIGNTPKKTIPFEGMFMLYQVFHTDPPPPPQLHSRMVTFYGEPSEPGFIWGRDSFGDPDDPGDDLVAKIDAETRKIAGQEGYTLWLFPTNLHVGDEVVLGPAATVRIIGSQRMSVMGKQVDAWIGFRDWDGVYSTYYYEKKTGIRLGFSSVWDDGDSYVVNLVSTNVPLFEED